MKDQKRLSGIQISILKFKAILKLNVMKKTIFLFALGLGSICLTSCSRGYGCPYTMEAKTLTPKTEKLNANDCELIATENEEIAIELVAD